MKIKLSNKDLNNIDTMNIEHIHPSMQQWFHLKSGAEHYRLLIHLGFLYNNIQIADIGTYRGASAIALAQNQNNKIYSVDLIYDCGFIPMKNIEFATGNFNTDKDIQENILKSSLIFLDIDHLYTNEIKFYNFLVENKWKGVMFCDDINLNSEMKKFWNEVSHKKMDVTKYGHWSGTGVIFFDETTDIDMV